MADYPVSKELVIRKLLEMRDGMAPYAKLVLDMALTKLQGLPAMGVVHGRWLPGVPITCSLCGKPAAEHGSTTEFWLSPYCPWCGQPMDAKEVEADG
jgi:hypothetical protein